MVAWSGARRGAALPRSRDTWARGYLAVGAVVMVAYITLPRVGLLPWWEWSLLLYGGLGLSAVAMILAGIRRHRPTAVVAWHLVVAGLLLYVVGDVLYDIDTGALDGGGGFGGIYDLCDLASYPFMMAGLLLLIRCRNPGSDRTTLIDALVIAGGAGLLAWALLLGPLAREPGLTLPARLLSFAYPVGDLLMLVMAARLAGWGGGRSPAAWLLVGGVTAALFSDSVYTYGQLVGGWRDGGLADLGWMVWYTCWGAAALHPSMARLSVPVPAAEVRLGPARLWLLAGARVVVHLSASRIRPTSSSPLHPFARQA